MKCLWGFCSWSHFSVAGSTLWTVTEWSRLYSMSCVKSKKKQVRRSHQFCPCCCLHIRNAQSLLNSGLNELDAARSCGAEQKAKEARLCVGCFYHQPIICYSHSLSHKPDVGFFSHNIVHRMNFTWHVRHVSSCSSEACSFFFFFTIGSLDNYLKQLLSIIVSKYERGFFFFFLMLLRNNREYWAKLSQATLMSPLVS